MSCLSFSDDDHVLALAGLILPQPTITAVLDVLGWLDVAAEIAAIDLGLAALAADVDAADAPRHGLAGLGGICAARPVPIPGRVAARPPAAAPERRSARFRLPRQDSLRGGDD